MNLGFELLFKTAYSAFDWLSVLLVDQLKFLKIVEFEWLYFLSVLFVDFAEVDDIFEEEEAFFYLILFDGEFEFEDECLIVDIF